MPYAAATDDEHVDGHAVGVTHVFGHLRHTHPPHPRTVPVVLFIVVRDPLGEPPACLGHFLDQLAQISPWNDGIDDPFIAWMWSEVEPGVLASTADVTPVWVLAQLRGAVLEHGNERIAALTGGALPYGLGGAFTHADILPVVVGPEWTGDRADPVEGMALGALPYFVAIGDVPDAPASPPGRAAFAVAKALGKVLGLGEEGEDPKQLSAPDRWGRALPNLWLPIDSAEECPWPPSAAPLPFDGGFGRSDFVKRPSADCLMGKRLGEGGDLCPVCCDYLREQLLGNHLELKPLAIDAVAFDPTTPSLGPVSVEPWPGAGTQQVLPELAISAWVDGIQLDPSSPPVWEEGTLAVEYPGADVRLSLRGRALASGRTITLEVSVIATDEKLPLPKVQLHFRSADLQVLRRSDDALGAFLEWLRGAPPAVRVPEELVARGPAWQSPCRSGESPATTVLGHTIEGGRHGLPGPSGLTLWWPGRAAINPARLWPLPMQGEGALALDELLHVAAALRPPDGDLAGADADLLLAYLQCAGVSERFPPVATTTAWQVDITDGQCIWAANPADAREPRAVFVWSSPGIPMVLDRLGRVLYADPKLPGIHPGTGHTPRGTPPREGLLQVDEVLERTWRPWASVVETPRFQRDATSDAYLLSIYLEYLTIPIHGYLSSLLGSQHRVLELLEAWAVAGRSDELIAAYEAHGGLFDAIMADTPWRSPGLGWASFVGRVRGLLFEHVGLDFAIRSHRTLLSNGSLGYDLDAVGRTMASLEEQHLRWAMANPDATVALFRDLETWFQDPDQLLGVRLQFARICEAYARADTFADLLDVARDVWLDAAAAYVDAYKRYEHRMIAPTVAMLATIPHARRAWRQELLAQLTGFDFDVRDDLWSAAGEEDELDFARAVLSLARSAYHEPSFGPPVKALAAALGAMVRGARVDLARAEALGDEAEPPNDPTSLASRLRVVIDAIHGQTTIDWLAGADIDEADRLEARAMLDLRLTDRTAHSPDYDDGETAWARYRIDLIDERGKKFEAFCQQTARVQALLVHERGFADSFGADHMGKVLEAVAMLSAHPAEPDGEWDGDRRDWNAWATGYLCHRAAVTAELWIDVDAALAAFVRQVVHLPAEGRAAVELNPLWVDAKGRLSGGSSGIEEHLLKYGIGLVCSMDPSSYAEGLRWASLSAIGPIHAPAQTIVNPRVYAEYLDYVLANTPPYTVSGLGELDARRQMRFGFVLTHRDLDGVSGSEADALRRIYEEHGGVIDYAVSRWDDVDPLMGERLRDVLFGVPILPALPYSPSGRLAMAAEGAFLEERGRQLEAASPSTWLIEDHFSTSGPERAEAQARFEVALARAVERGALANPGTLEALVELYAVARQRAVAAEASQQAIANFAVAAAVTVAAVGVSIATAGAGAPLAAAAIAAVAAGATAGVVTRVAIEGPAYVSPDEVRQDVTSAVIEGTMDVMTGGAIRGAKALMTVGRMSKAARAGGEVVEAAVQTSRARELAAAAIEGAIEGALGGATSELVQTAMDGATWDMSVRQSLSRMGRAAVGGLLMGGGFGAVGGVGGELFVRLVGALGVEKGIAAARALAASGRPELADELRDLADLNGITTAMLRGDYGDAIIEARRLGLSAESEELLVDAVSRYLYVLRAAEAGHAGLSTADVLGRVQLRVLDDDAFDALGSAYVGRSARVALGSADAASGGLRPSEIVLRRSDGAERFYEELIHSGRLQAAQAGELGDGLDDVRTVVAARDAWEKLKPREKAEAHLALAREEAVVRQLAIDYLDAQGSLDAEDLDALGRGILGQQEADWKAERLEDEIAAVDDDWLRENGFDEPPEFFGKRRPESVDPALWERQLAFWEQAPKVGKRRKLSPDPVKAGSRWDPTPGGTSTYRFDASETASAEQRALAAEFPDGIQYDANLVPRFAAMVSEEVGAFGVMLRSEELASKLGIEVGDLPIQLREYVRLELSARTGAESRFSDNRPNNFRYANQEMARMLDIDAWEPPGGYTWHEELNVDTCVATLVLVRTIVHSNVPHTGGVAAVKAGACR